MTWGWFQGGFDNGFVPGQGTPPTTAQICSQTHQNVGGNTVVDYNPHHEPFQYYASTANPMHLPPTSVHMIGRNDQANHQYDIADFWAAADDGNLPQVSYLKAPDYQDGHAGYSDPTDEQNWLVSTVNHLQSLGTWKSTAIVITYDDSDGWYDHVLGPVLTQSQTSLDTLTGAAPVRRLCRPGFRRTTRASRSRAAAVSAPGCRSCWSRRGRRPTTCQARCSIRPRWSSSLRTTGTFRPWEMAPPTPRPGRST